MAWFPAKSGERAGDDSLSDWHGFEKLFIQSGLTRQDVVTADQAATDAMLVALRLHQVQAAGDEVTSHPAIDGSTQAAGHRLTWLRYWPNFPVLRVQTSHSRIINYYAASTKWQGLTSTQQLLVRPDGAYMRTLRQPFPDDQWETRLILGEEGYVYLNWETRLTRTEVQARSTDGTWHCVNDLAPGRTFTQDGHETVVLTIEKDAASVRYRIPAGRPISPVQAPLYHGWQQVLPGLRVRISRVIDNSYEYQVWRFDGPDDNFIGAPAAGRWLDGDPIKDSAEWAILDTHGLFLYRTSAGQDSQPALEAMPAPGAAAA